MVLCVRRPLVFFCTCFILPLEITGWPGPMPVFYKRFDTSNDMYVISDGIPAVPTLVQTHRGRAVTLDHTLRQWIDLNLVTEPCLTRPDTCDADGGSLSFWARIRCSTYSGILSSQRQENGRGIHIGCTPHGVSTSINIEGGYYVKFDDDRPLVEWSHIVVNYYVDVLFRTHNAFTTFVNGETVFSDGRKYEQDTTPGYGRLVIGRAFTSVDNYYTSMEVDQVVFFNEILTNENINWLLRNNL